MPTFLYVNQVEKERRPNSENVLLIGENGLFEKKEETKTDETLVENENLKSKRIDTGENDENTGI